MKLNRIHMRANKLAKPGVLIVDDDEDIRSTIRDVLADQGFTVACAANGREALEMLISGQSKPALILLLAVSRSTNRFLSGRWRDGRRAQSTLSRAIATKSSAR